MPTAREKEVVVPPGLPPSARALWARIVRTAEIAQEEDPEAIAKKGLANAGWREGEDGTWVLASKLARAQDGMTWSIPIVETKAVGETLKVFGWGSVSVDDQGELVVDHDDQIIDAAELERGVYDFVRNARAMDADHDFEAKGRLIESAFMSPSKRVAMGLDGTGRVAWWSGFELSDPATIERVKAGELAELSIAWRGRTEDVKGTKARPGEPGKRPVQRIKDLEIGMLSLVPQGAGKGVTVCLYKSRQKPKEKAKMSLEEILAALPEEQRRVIQEALAAAAQPKAEPPKPEDEMPPAAKARLDAFALEIKAAHDEVKKLRDEKVSREYLEKARVLGLEYLPGATLEQHAKSLRAVEETLSAEDAKAIVGAMTKAASAVKASALLASHGSTREGDTSDALGKLRLIAKAKQEKDATLSEAAAFVLACKEQPALYAEHRKGA